MDESPATVVADNDPDRSTRERILAAAHAVFLRRGTAAARTLEIAEEAGVNKALLHYHFGTKAALAETVFRTAIAAFFPRLFGVLASSDLTIAAKVRRVVDEQIDFHTAHPYLAGYLITEAQTNADRLPTLMTGAGRPPLQILAAQLEAEVAAGRMRPITVQQFVLHMAGLSVGPFVLRPLMQHVMGLDDDQFQQLMQERRAQLADFMLAGLRP